MKRTVAVLTLLLAVSAVALAHGNEKHILGTVTSISANSMTVETSAQQSVTVEFTERTKFEKNGSPATAKDLKVGDRVVIHADASGDRLVANEVHFGATKKMQAMRDMDQPHDFDSSPQH
jgi:hypothetical protein